jgi:hypothetical protein
MPTKGPVMPIVRLVGWVAALLAAVVIGIAALTFMPVNATLPPCMRDWTSPSSFRFRASPLLSQKFRIGFGEARLCYGQPSAKGRPIFGNLVPFGELWRLGANEPTRLYTTIPISIAGIDVPAGKYSLYAVPGASAWEIAVNNSTFHWGKDFSAGVLRKEIARATVETKATAGFVEALTMTTTAVQDTVLLIVEWERTRVEIPLVPR